MEGLGPQLGMIVDDDNLQTIVEALDNISDAFVIYDAAGRLVVCNENFKKLYRYSDDEARPGVHFRDLGRLDLERGNVVIGDEIGDGEAYLRRKAQYRDTLEGSFTVRLADGRRIRTADRRTKGGGFVSIQTDVTEMKAAEQALVAAKEVAEAANRAKSEFLANMSHELRTPLNAIIGFASVIEQELYGRHTAAKYKEYGHDIGKAGSHLLSLINDILDLSKVESNTVRLAEGVIDPVELNAWCASLFEEMAHRKQVRLEMAADRGFLLLGDSQRVRQIVVNLVTNALKFTPAGGRVSVGWALDDGAAVLTVADTGEGIDPELMPHLFQPFRQGRRRDNVLIEGAGLGLALVKRFAELHGGTVSADSAVGTGTTMTVRLPFERVVTREARAQG